jgi:hypothetical protein
MTEATLQEIDFIGRLAVVKPDLARRYCYTVLVVPRVWDTDADQIAIRDFALKTYVALRSKGR